MSEYYFIFSIALVLCAGAMSPGPSFLVVAQNTLLKSRSHGIATALGTGLGVAVFAVLASLGVTALLNTVPGAFLLFKILGGAYLMYLAFRIWKGSSQALVSGESDADHSKTLFQSFISGLVTQISNPKTALVIAGIFAAFVPPSPPLYAAWLVAGVAFIIDFSWYAIVAITLSKPRSKALYARAKTVFDRVAAGFLCVVAVKLFTSQA